MNILTLNLRHEIVTGSRNVTEAREAYAENAVAHTVGRTAPPPKSSGSRYRLMMRAPRAVVSWMTVGNWSVMSY